MDLSYCLHEQDSDFCHLKDHRLFSLRKNCRIRSDFFCFDNSLENGCSCPEPPFSAVYRITQSHGETICKHGRENQVCTYKIIYAFSWKAKKLVHPGFNTKSRFVQERFCVENSTAHHLLTTTVAILKTHMFLHQCAIFRTFYIHFLYFFCSSLLTYSAEYGIL